MPIDPETEAYIIEDLLDGTKSVRNAGHALERRDARDAEYAIGVAEVRAGDFRQSRVNVVPGEPVL